LHREEQEKEDKLMTLEDYLKTRKNTPVVALPQERKANEGVETAESKKWKTYQLLKREGEAAEKETSENAPTESKDRKKKEKNTVPLNEVFNVKEPQRKDDRPFRGGRGGRGGGRGRGGSGRGREGSGRGRGVSNTNRRGGKDDSSAPKFDESSFPKLN